ncbi:MAG: transglutaminase-like domain-containing protein [Clostridium sp.]|uniref:transglutaminase-like domain-containing protein n=1 Tax=Clostridium TaxID=1485 RepID=UPI001159CA5A|nr:MULTISPECIES: transglutaminase-like domain-containing protein [Clostridium]MDB1968064.1 transglutaminase-like domain-containing protein [Clostridium tertium]MDU1565970.1 transglutaminase-like domain-containing protein [Clostridium sp.]MDU2458794.1 transglutaminase-like domain-containing protein [Clostridium sp.]MDU3406099.1 transglutaminase-like domain-containing protein [Clostridium sp.]MDU3546775.1 transglutaminase-like domain-containing protein [Clostridium sp.]
MDKYLEETKLLNFSSICISDLIKKERWMQLSDYNKIFKIYNYVRDDIEFGYNEDDAITASKVLEDGYGQCNTKGILLMALLRVVGIKCRIHGFTIDKALQKGAMKGFYYSLAPNEIVHSWVEVYYNSKWYNLEGFILDIKYLNKLQNKFSSCTNSFCGYGVATKDFQNPIINWNENDTYIQKEGIVRDFGIFDNPDEFLKRHSQVMSPIKKFIYRKFIRHLMNRNISRIRDSIK